MLINYKESFFKRDTFPWAAIEYLISILHKCINKIIDICTLREKIPLSPKNTTKLQIRLDVNSISVESGNELDNEVF